MVMDMVMVMDMDMDMDMDMIGDRVIVLMIG